jgi:hypothetical protein
VGWSRRHLLSYEGGRVGGHNYMQKLNTEQKLISHQKNLEKLGGLVFLA